MIVEDRARIKECVSVMVSEKKKEVNLCVRRRLDEMSLSCKVCPNRFDVFTI